MAILGLLEYANETGRNHFITTTIEHKSVLEAMKYLEKHGKRMVHDRGRFLVSRGGMAVLDV